MPLKHAFESRRAVEFDSSPHLKDGGLLSRLVKRLGKNANYARLSGKNAPFYRVAYHFNLAIENLLAKEKIEAYTKNGATYFKVLTEEKVPEPKITRKEYSDKSSARLFLKDNKPVYPSPQSFPAVR